MTKRLKVGVDVDGVLGDFVAAFNRTATQVLGRPITKRPTVWSFEDVMPKEDFRKVWAAIKASDNWFLKNVQAFPVVPRALANLCLSADVYFISTRIETKGLPVKEQTGFFLSQIGIVNPTVIIIDNKGPLAAALELNAFVDDKPENLEQINAATHGKTKCFLMEQPHNKAYKLPTNWVSVPSFPAFVAKVGQLKHE